MLSYVFGIIVVASVLYAVTYLVQSTLSEEPEPQLAEDNTLQLSIIEKQLLTLERRARAMPLSKDETEQYSRLIYSRNQLTVTH